ncbi:MAG TPA: accessory factor UbiK family protein [Chromatiales bacterium]|nr:accessory factor UbiK family protein [Chromatiales bacterium]
MMDSDAIDQLARKLADNVPESIGAARDDLRRHFGLILQDVLGHLDLVTREEFDIQRKVLERSREKLGALERRVQELETELEKASRPPTGEPR